MVALPLGAVNATDTTVSLIAVGIKLVGGEGRVVIERTDELVDAPFMLVAVRKKG